MFRVASPIYLTRVLFQNTFVEGYFNFFPNNVELNQCALPADVEVIACWALIEEILLFKILGSALALHVV